MTKSGKQSGCLYPRQNLGIGITGHYAIKFNCDEKNCGPAFAESLPGAERLRLHSSFIELYQMR